MGRSRAWGIAPASAQAGGGAAAAAGLPSSHMSSSTVISSPPSNGAAIGAGASAGATAKSTLAVMTVGASNKNLVSMMTIDGGTRKKVFYVSEGVTTAVFSLFPYQLRRPPRPVVQTRWTAAEDTSSSSSIRTAARPHRPPRHRHHQGAVGSRGR